MAGSAFAAWYRRYYLLVNLPALLIATELVMTRVDPVHRSHGSNLDRAMERYRASPPGGACAGVMLIVGNSVVRSGIDQDALERGLPGWRVYNFGLNTARFDDEALLLEHVRSQGIAPQAILVGINLYSIRDVPSDSRYPWHRRRSPYVFFHREFLWGAIKDRLTHLIAPQPARPYSQFASAVLGPEELEVQARTFIGQFAHHTAADFPLLDQLAGLLRGAADHGIRVHVVLLPMNPIATGFAEYPALVAAIRARVPAGSLDLTGEPYPRELFDDVGHLGEAGRQRLTARIVDWLAHDGGPP